MDTVSLTLKNPKSLKGKNRIVSKDLDNVDWYGIFKIKYIQSTQKYDVNDITIIV